MAEKIRLANGEFYASQMRQVNGQTEFDLTGTLIFTAPYQVTCSFGIISLGVREARLVVSFDNCRLPQRHMGYRRAMPDVATAQKTAEDRKESSRRYKFFGKCSLTGIFGSGVEGEIGGGANSSVSSSQTMTRNAYLVSAEGVDPDKQEASWMIRNLDPDRHLEGEVFGDEDFGGNLGRIEASSDASWCVQPRLEWMPSAEILGKEQLDLKQRAAFEREYLTKRSLAAIVLAKDAQFEHQDFEPVLPKPASDGEAE